MNHKEQISKLKDLIGDNKICMLVTESQGVYKSRPMQTIEIDDEGSLWYFTNEFSHKVKEIAKENKVHACYASAEKNTYLSVNATASLVEDREKMKELWSPVLKAWFPDGLEDNALLLIKLKPEEIEYWDAPSSKMVVAFNMIKAIATGDTYNGNGDHGTIHL